MINLFIEYLGHARTSNTYFILSLWQPGRLGIILPNKTEARRESLLVSGWSGIQPWSSLISKAQVLSSELYCLWESKAPKKKNLIVKK